MTEVRIPENPPLPQAIQAAAAVAQTVEVLLVREREARPDARGTVGVALDGHPAVGWLAQEPCPGGVRKRQPQRARLDLEPQIARRQTDQIAGDNLHRGRRPGA